MNDAERNLTIAYLRGYGDTTKDWNPELHLAGLAEVFRAGADAGRRQVGVPSAAEVWAAAMKEAGRVIIRRKATYEAHIDLLASENPYEVKP